MRERGKFTTKSIVDTGSEKKAKKYIYCGKEGSLVRRNSRFRLEVVRSELGILPSRL